MKQTIFTAALALLLVAGAAKSPAQTRYEPPDPCITATMEPPDPCVLTQFVFSLLLSF
jgi:hypothetical protein